ncbi:hypothetical protein HU985_18530 [Photobacterium damselae subsp. damselae]|uniref:hypothetical protein n=1 Tax=Photobacterium damselae TaxID=38293 RepID=UPI0015938AA6|nr:hypothetical protein [Photobacterium damselae]NVH52895.1 hypothetical protein [Photobacterium damselae subsp. damselae]NVO80915.1 hypothetical protein [Photobacterium damselae subsp. damselae]
MIDLYLDRQPNEMTDNSHLISTSEQWLTESDLVMLKKERRLNLEFDFKRKLVNPRMVEVDGKEHISFDSVPWRSAEEAQQARVLFDGWRADNCLKTMADWESWEDYYESAITTKGTGIKLTAEGSSGVLRRIFIRAAVHKQWGCDSGLTYKALAEQLTGLGYKTTSDECKNAKRSKLPEHAVPVTVGTIKFIKVLLDHYPAMDLYRMFPQGRLDEVMVRLAEV